MKYVSILFLIFNSFNINAQYDFLKTDLTDLNKRSLKADKRNFKILMKFIDENKFDEISNIEKIKNIWHSKSNDTDSLEFGVKRFNFQLVGGYTAYFFTVCTLENKIISFKIFLHRKGYDILDFLAQKDTTIKIGVNKLLKQWQIHKTPEGNCYTFNIENKIYFEKYKNSVETKFGKLQNLEFSDSLTKKLYLYMINPINHYSYNEELGLITDTFRIEDWEKLNRIDIVKNVLIGYNPIGRVLATEKLLTFAQNKQYELTQEDIIIIKKIINSDIKIEWYRGHVGYVDTIKNFFKKNSILSELLKSNGIN